MKLQYSQLNTRSDRDSKFLTKPQLEQILELENYWRLVLKIIRIYLHWEL